jgi:sec-independent protein translocase protein TatB
VFGIGGSELIVILIVALLFLGPDKLPEAAKTISKGIRDLKRGQREIQQTIENDETIGGALRDLRSALRGDDPPPRRPKAQKPVSKTIDIEADEVPELAKAPVPLELPPTIHDPAAPTVPDAQLSLALLDDAQAQAPVPAEPPRVKLPAEAGEADPDHKEGEHDREELAALIRPATGTVPKDG